jgi:hypothetical protein
MMKTALASLFALSLLASAGPAAADGGVGVGVHVGDVGVGAGIHAGGDHHRRHVCGGWGYRNHARYCRRWYWR